MQLKQKHMFSVTSYQNIVSQCPLTAKKNFFNDTHSKAVSRNRLRMSLSGIFVNNENIITTVFEDRLCRRYAMAFW